MKHKGGARLPEDETLSPSFEDTIVLWALEEIDSHLPKKAKRDMQVTILQSIPTMIEELNKQADFNALTTEERGDAQLSAVRHFQGSRGGGSFQGGSGGGGGGGGGDRRHWSKIL